MKLHNSQIGLLTWLLVIIFPIITLINLSNAYSVNNNPYRHFVTLDNFGKFNVEWLVDWQERRVSFKVIVQAHGSVGFGLVKKRGTLEGADVIVGGVWNGAPYFKDKHIPFGREPVEDPTTQDWDFNGADENGTHTLLKFSRKFDTCDVDYDLPITDDLSTFIWAYSEVDNVNPFGENGGEYDSYVLDPDYTPDLEEFKRLERAGVKMNMTRFPMTASLPLPPVDTMYWCHFFRVPTNTKRHIVGFNTVLPTATDKEHVHHLLVHRCRAPPGQDPEAFFDYATRTQGTECFFQVDQHELPTQNCQEVIHLWGVGGRPIFFPGKAGISMSEDGTEYFMIQVHYDNPQILRRTVTFSVEAYYTEEIRENEVAMVPLGEMTPSATTIVIPPNSVGHVILGHCPSACLQKMLPEEGVTVFAGFLHTHLLGNGVRFRHFRGDKELPWISNADNYNFNFQQFRSLIEERVVLPGDQLGMRCSYDTTPRNGSTVVGGHSTRDEMCTGHLYYYTKSPFQFSFCRSEIKTREYMDRLGIYNTTWDPTRRQMMVTDPPEYAGLTVYEYANRYIRWTPELSEAIQRDHRLQPHTTQCPIVDDTPPLLPEWEASAEIAWNPLLRGVPLYKKPGQCSRMDFLKGLGIYSWGKPGNGLSSSWKF